MELEQTPSRKHVFHFLFDSSRYGNLGLFVGAGFSKAVFSSEEENPALSWGELLAECAKSMDVSPKLLETVGTSYPEIASLLSREYSSINKTSFGESLQTLRTEICKRTALFPSKEQRDEYSSYLQRLRPAWIVTTNYDQVLECLLPGKSLSLGPFDAFVSTRRQIPIFHLHGVRTKPNELIIAQEDYVELFRPNTYRQIRLTIAMKEATTCLLGYGLGDVNVLTALDWSKNVFSGSGGGYPHEVIQIVRASHPKDAPYRLHNGVVVMEVPDLPTFFEEFLKSTKTRRLKRRRQQQEMLKLAEAFRKADAVDVTRFIDDSKWRREILGLLCTFTADIVAEFEIFFEACLAEAKRRSSVTGAFNQYAVNLHLLLDFLTAFQCEELPPALVPITVRAFDRVAPYIGDTFGSSWSAQEVWNARKTELSDATIAELMIVAKQYGAGSLRHLLQA